MMTFNIREFEEFCRGKPADEEYEGDWNACALAQFGFPALNMFNFEENGVPTEVYVAAAYARPRTFGALADRLSKIGS